MNRGRLTVRMVSAISAPGLYGDGNTLFLRVALGGSKQWVQRLTIRGKRHDIGLGCCGWVTLDAARRAALENRRVARQGSDQLAARRQARVPTFHEEARRTHEAPRPRWRSKKVAVNWMQQLERYAFKRLGAIRVDRIGREDVHPSGAPSLRQSSACAGTSAPRSSGARCTGSSSSMPPAK